MNGGSSGIAGKKAHMGVIQHTSSSLPSQGKYAEKVLLVEQAIASSFQHPDLVVEVFHEVTVLTLHEIIVDLFPPVFQGVQEIIEALHFTELDPFDPVANLLLCIRFGK
jgi:hypothetical protein